MDKELYEALQASAHGEQVSIEGKSYVTQQVYLPPDEPIVKPLRVHSLVGFVDYATHHRDSLATAGVMIHVASPILVSLVGALYGRNDHMRNTYCEAHAIPGDQFALGRYQDHESFIVGLLSQFDVTTDRNALLRVLGNLQSEAILTHVDDGITQTVTARAGIARVAQVDVPNPVTLRPFRTFAEVKQPESLYVFRLQAAKEGKPQAALFAVEDHRWQLEAIESIKTWLAERITDIPIVG